MTNRFCPNCGAHGPGRFCSSCGEPQHAELHPQAGAGPSTAPLGPTVSNSLKWQARVERALSIRLMFISIFCASIVGALAGALWEPLTAPVVVVTWLVAWLGAVLNDEQMAKCDVCRKRVKFGATTCHHCGYSRATA